LRKLNGYIDAMDAGRLLPLENLEYTHADHRDYSEYRVIEAPAAESSATELLDAIQGLKGLKPHLTRTLLARAQGLSQTATGEAEGISQSAISYRFARLKTLLRQSIAVDPPPSLAELVKALRAAPATYNQPQMLFAWVNGTPYAKLSSAGYTHNRYAVRRMIAICVRNGATCAEWLNRRLRSRK